MATEKNYTDCDGLNAMEGICYQKTSNEISRKFKLSKLEKINEMYFRKN